MGLALLDTSVVIAALNGQDVLHRGASAAILAERERHALAVSTLTYAEMLVGPMRVGRRAVEVVERFVAQVRLLDVTPEVARAAAELRARRNLRLPDAVVVATGMRHRADVILTGDARWRGLAKVRVIA